MNREFVRRLGRAAGGHLAANGTDAPPLAVIGRDTRGSGPELEDALVAGLRESGIDVIRLGAAPTPAVALAVLGWRAGLGAVVTASHNPADDNGVKFFSGAGEKLADDAVAEIERCIDNPDTYSDPLRAGVERKAAEGIPYEEKVAGVLPDGALAGWTVVLDTAHGAAFRSAPAVLRRLGAEVAVLGDAPDGRNINDGAGSQHPRVMAERVPAAGARLGIALDGDGDRVVFADETGSVLSGDEVLAILGLSALKRGVLAHDTVVATVQSNLGLDRAIREAGGRVERTDIGDRHVIARMREGGFNFGGESSGHILFPEVSPAGDGLLAGLKMMEVMRETGLPLSELRRWMQAYPQLTRSLKTRGRPGMETLVHLAGAIREAESGLGVEGRVLVRYSGTEPKLRFLVEGRDRAAVERWMERLTAAAGRDGVV